LHEWKIRDGIIATDDVIDACAGDDGVANEIGGEGDDDGEEEDTGVEPGEAAEADPEGVPYGSGEC
jgi:hypothetical protein